VLSVQDRICEHAVFQTLGFRGHQIARLIVMEGLVLSVTGAVVGGVAALAFLSYSALALSVESYSIPVKASPTIFVQGVAIAAAAGVLAGLVPAWQASRREIATCFRAA
jgi:putative ABC transport system permease protein